MGELDYGDLLKLEIQLDDLLLPYKIDLSLFYKISDPDLIDLVRRHGKAIFLNQNI